MHGSLDIPRATLNLDVAIVGRCRPRRVRGQLQDMWASDAAHMTALPDLANLRLRILDVSSS